MSRVIKFRAWNPRISKMSQNTITIETLAEAGCKVQVDGLVWLQFTGLTDCNGVEIYDGDVMVFGVEVNYQKAEYRDTVGAVEWDNTWGLWRWKYIDQNGEVNDYMADCFGGGKVIGNIYEHPHLLNRSSEQS